MTIDPREASAALDAVERSRARATMFRGYANAGDALIAWGVVWLAGNLAVQFAPPFAGWAWAAGIAGAVLFTVLRSKRPSDPRPFATAAALFGFVALLMAIVGGGERTQSAVVSLLVAVSYVVLGIWTGQRFAWLGLALAAMIAAGWFLFPASLYLWLGIGGGGALILAGLWLRRA